MEMVEQRAVIKYLQKKGMLPSQIHEEMMATLGESAVSYGIVKRWFRTFKCGRMSCEDDHRGGPPRTVTTPENINKVHDIVLQDRRITIRDIQCSRGNRLLLSYCPQYFGRGIGHEKIDCKMDASNVDAGSETTKNSTL